MHCARPWCRWIRPRGRRGSRPQRRAVSTEVMPRAVIDRETHMISPQLTSAELAALAAFDTPTICNALEVVLPELRGGGYTTRPALCGFPALKPVVGYARTARIRAKSPSPVTAIRELQAAAERVARREARVLAVARDPGCTAEKLIAVFNEHDAIH